jgi:thioredoxin reductase (NADPH)
VRSRFFLANAISRSTSSANYGARQFVAEMAQLAAQPSLLSGVALIAVDTLVTTSERLRALIVADAELGERIMRALILRRLGLIEQGLGPIVVGFAHEKKARVATGLFAPKRIPIYRDGLQH